MNPARSAERGCPTENSGAGRVSPRLRRLLRLLPGASLVALGAVGGCGTPPADGARFEPGVFPAEPPLLMLASTLGGLRVSVWTAPAPPRKGASEVMYRIVDAAGVPSSALDLTVTPWMPAHGHGASAPVPVTRRGEGHYLASPIYFHMSGRWELRTTLGADDEVVPILDVP